VTPENAGEDQRPSTKGSAHNLSGEPDHRDQPATLVLAPLASGGPQRNAGAGAVVLTQPAEIENDFIFAMLGAELPTASCRRPGFV